MNLVETTVDGVYTLFVEQDSPQTRAGLVFRVGQADESLAVRGLTHLVQHLALHDVVGNDVHTHGSTGVLHTEFLASGSAADVARILNGVCAALREPPVEHLASVRAVLDTEDVATDRSGCRSAAVRHGAQAHGLESYPELGLPGLGEVDVTTWASVAFTRGNAVLWVIGPRLPKDLDLELPDGATVEPPDSMTVLPRTPAWYLDPGAGDVEVSALLPRTPAADLLVRILELSLQQETASPERLADEVLVDRQPHDAELQAVSLVLRGRPETSPALVGAVVDALARLRWGSLPSAEVTRARNSLLDDLEVPNAIDELVPRLAREALLGDNPARRPDPEHALSSVTEAELREVGEQLVRTALVRAPDPGLAWAGFETVGRGSSWAVEGRELLARDGSDEVLVIGEEGVTRSSGFRVATVRYEDVALLQRFEDGGRWVTGNDGAEVRVEPRLFGVDAATLAALDDAVDSAHVVHLPARAAERIPGPAPSPLVELKEPPTVPSPHTRTAEPAAGAPDAAGPTEDEGTARRGFGGLFRRRSRDG